jgi:hypothetical protein
VASAPDTAPETGAPGGTAAAPEARGGVGRPVPAERGGTGPRDRASLGLPPVGQGEEAPQGGGSSGSGAGSGGDAQGSGGGKLPGVSVPGLPPEVTNPELPDPNDPVAALEPVTDLLPPAVQDALPQVQVPGLEVPGVQLPGVQVPGVQLPGVQLPSLGQR